MSHAQSVQFDISGLIREAWDRYTANLGVFLGGFLLIAIILNVANYAFFVGSLVLQGPLMLGFYYAALKQVRGGHSEIGDLFTGFQRFLPAFLANLVFSIFAGVGILLCILPGIFVIILYMPLFCMLADDVNNDWWGAMERTRALVMDNLGQWVILFLVIFALNLAGLLACGIGVLVTAPMSLLIIAQAYNQSVAGAIPPMPESTPPSYE